MTRRIAVIEHDSSTSVEQRAAKFAKGDRVSFRSTRKGIAFTGKGTVQLIWLALDAICIDVLRDNGAVVSILLEFGDTLEKLPGHPMKQSHMTPLGRAFFVAGWIDMALGIAGMLWIAKAAPNENAVHLACLTVELIGAAMVVVGACWRKKP
jgi:hypothetical protein